MPALVLQWWRGRSPERVRKLTLLMLFCAFSIFSIVYFPDSIHIAFIAPIFVVASATMLEWALRLLPVGAHRPLAAAIAAAILLSGGLQLYQQLITLRAAFPVNYQSAFGRIAYQAASPWPKFWDQLGALLEAGPSRSLFFYPIPAYNYLISGTQNPTRFSLIVPGPYTPPDQIQEILRDLADKRVAYVVAAPSVAHAGDPIAAFIREHYEPTADPQPLARFLWRRKDQPAHAGGSDDS